MKYLSSVTLILAMMAGTAQAKINVTIEQVAANSSTPEGAFAQFVPSGFSAWQVIVHVEDTTADGEPNGFIAAQLFAALTEGEFYYDAIEIPNVGTFPTNAGHLQVGNGADARTILTSRPQARFDTSISAPGHFANPFLGSASTIVEIELNDGSIFELEIEGIDPFPPAGEPPLSPGLVARRRPFMAPNSFGLQNQQTSGFFNMGFFDIPDTDPNSDLFNPVYGIDGDYVIAMLTISDDAQGLVRLIVNDAENAGTTPDEQQFFIVDGVIPEPSTFVLSALGLMGLGFVRTRRRRKR